MWGNFKPSGLLILESKKSQMSKEAREHKTRKKKQKVKRLGPGWDVKGNALDGYRREYWADPYNPLEASPFMAGLCVSIFFLLCLGIMVVCWMP